MKNNTKINIKDLNSQYVDVKTFSKFTNKIENLLKNMIISDIDEIYQSYDKSITIELLKKGFSKNIVSEFQEKINNHDDVDPDLFYYHYLAKT